MNTSKSTPRPWLYAAAIAAVAAMLGACASTPPPAASPSAAAATHASSGSATEKPAPGNAIEQVKLVKEAWQSGLPVHVAVDNGNTYFCWSDTSIGSMIPSTKCLTESQLRTVLTERRQARRRMQNSGALPCTQAKLCGGG